MLDNAVMGYGEWESAINHTHSAIDRIPKDIIICDWHYELRDDYPSVRYFQEQGFRVLPAPWKKPDAAVALIRCARKDATDKMLGVLFTGWSAGGYPVLFTGLRNPDVFRALALMQPNFEPAFVQPCLPFMDRNQPILVT